MKHLLTTFLILIQLPCFAQSPSEAAFPTKKFDGLYLGLNAGVQNVFGGSFVNEMDILAQESKLVSELAIGYRKQFLKNRVVAGLEASLGFLDGSLSHDAPEEQLFIDYKTSSQYSIGIQLGTTVGSKQEVLLFAYANETKRTFNVDIMQRQYDFSQTDKQGMLKYGIGVEWNVYKRLNIRSTFGALNVDFGELKTNIDVEDKFDFTLGVVFQL